MLRVLSGEGRGLPLSKWLRAAQRSTGRYAMEHLPEAAEMVVLHHQVPPPHRECCGMQTG